jgi:RND superfamily putative drug exporter
MLRLARFVTHRAKATLIVSVLVIIALGALSGGAFGALQDGGFDDPNSESSRALHELESRYGGVTNLLLLVTPRNGNIDDASVDSAAAKLTEQLRQEPHVARVQSYWPEHNVGLRAKDGTSALIAVDVAGDEIGSREHGTEIAEKYAVSNDLYKIDAGGAVGANVDIDTAVKDGLAKAEMVAIPVTTVLLIIAFGALIAALLPLMIGLIAIIGALAMLFVIGSVTDVSVFALNLTTAMGLGLAIDYALLVVNRFREELAGGKSTNDAVVKTMTTAGRTIVFSGATVAVALGALLVFAPFFLRSFAYAGIAVVMVAMVGAIVVLPAVLTLLGTRVDKLKVFGRPPQYGESKAWHRLASTVYRRPLLTGLPVLILLIVMSLPLANISFATPDDRVMMDSSSRVVGDAMRTQYLGNEASAMYIVLDRPTDAAGATAYVQSIERLNGVDHVATEDNTLFHVATNIDPMSSAAQELVHDIRDTAEPAGTTALLGGNSAALVDGKEAISGKLGLAIAWIVVTTFVLLFAFTGSLLLPLKALLLNALTLGAVMGAMTWIFQYGNWADIIGFTPQPLSTTMPVLLFCIAFGLSMDYEVFLLSRIKEAHDAGANNEDAVVEGLAKTGRIVSTAAGLLAVSFFAFSTSDVAFMQFFGLGTGLAVVLDATLVRGVLVPALMRLAGNANWWTPKPLQAVYRRIALSEA